MVQYAQSRLPVAQLKASLDRKKLNSILSGTGSVMSPKAKRLSPLRHSMNATPITTKAADKPALLIPTSKINFASKPSMVDRPLSPPGFERISIDTTVFRMNQTKMKNFLRVSVDSEATTLLPRSSRKKKSVIMETAEEVAFSLLEDSIQFDAPIRGPFKSPIVNTRVLPTTAKHSPQRKNLKELLEMPPPKDKSAKIKKTLCESTLDSVLQTSRQLSRSTLVAVTAGETPDRRAIPETVHTTDNHLFESRNTSPKNALQVAATSATEDSPQLRATFDNVLQEAVTVTTI